MGNKYDAIIIGAGPAGLAAARELAASGARVAVLEKNREIGRKVCAGGITWSGLLKEVPGKLIAATFKEQRIVTPLQDFLIREEHPIIATLSRQKLGRWMAEAAAAAGAEIICGRRVEAIDQGRLRLNGEEISFDHLIGCDGSSSMVRRYLGLAADDYGIGIDYRVAGEFPRMEWHLSPRLFGNGYAWIFPHDGSASIGAYCHCRTMSAAKLNRAFLTWARDHGIGLGQTPPRAARINLAYQGWRFGRTFLAGDAAGLASALTGEGILPAVISGRAAARAIIHPEEKTPAMDRLARKWAIHRRMVRLTSSPLFRGPFFEPMILAIRAGLISFKALEMG